MTMKEFIFEVYGEEIPARFQPVAEQQLRDIFTKNAAGIGLGIDNCRAYVTPQRLSVHAYVADSIPANTVEKRGPRVGAPQKAIEGFCKGAGVSIDQIMEKDGYYCVSLDTPAQRVEDVLPNLLNQTLLAMQWPKTMRWPNSPTPWVRPVRHLFALLDGKGFEAMIPAFNLNTMGYTFGHRFLSPDKIHPTSFLDYQIKLKAAHVILDAAERKKMILENLEKEAAKHNLTLIVDDTLATETAGLVEYPGVFMGHLDEVLFKAPEEVITTSMRFHQKCFAFRRSDGKLAPFFAAIINTVPKDGGAALTRGYEMGMLKARLDDARFFYEHDLKIQLIDYKPKLESIIFHEKLGTLGDKLRRMHGASGAYAAALHLDLTENLTRAIDLCKSDLLTQMVGEFAELQGVMGEIYGKEQGETADVSVALKEYYQPVSAEGDVPTQPLSIALALLDRMDTLSGFIGHGILPTGSKDPFALRRAALGVIRIILESHLSLSIKELVQSNVASYTNLKPSTLVDLLSFIHTRAAFYWKENGFSHGIIKACMPGEGEDLNLVTIQSKMTALQHLLQTETGKALLAGYKRAANICKDHTSNGALQDTLFIHEAEKALARALQGIEAPFALATDSEKCTLLASLKDPIDAFFEAVMVNDPDPNIRENRLALLARVLSFFNAFAQFSEVE